MSADSSKKSPLILIIDDEPQIRRLLRITLEAGGFHVFDAANGNDGLVQVAQRRPDLVLLDLGLPDADGLSVLKRLREWSQVPVIILTVRDQEDDKISALDGGADDYVTKPFGTGELLARIRAALRHSNEGENQALFQLENLTVDLANHIVRKQGTEVKLTPTEYALLRLFVTHSGKVLTHRFLLTEIWGPKAEEQTQYLRVHIAHLREKVENDPACPRWIITEPAVGYRLTVDVV